MYLLTAFPRKRKIAFLKNLFSPLVLSLLEAGSANGQGDRHLLMSQAES